MDARSDTLLLRCDVSKRRCAVRLQFGHGGEAAEEVADDANFVQESLVDIFHDAAAEFSREFDNELGLGCKRPMTLRLHEQVEELRQVKLRIEETESGDGKQLADVDDINEFLDGVDDALDSRDRIEIS